MDHGYTLLWRKTWNNPVLHERGKRFSKFEAWLYLTNVLASGLEKNGLHRGEFEASIRYLAKAWLWSLATVHNFLHQLEDSGMIKRVKSPERFAERFAERFTICNYNRYNPTANALPNALPNKLKEGIKERINKTSSPVGAGMNQSPSAEAVRLSELLRSRIAARDGDAKAGKLPVPPGWAIDMDKLLRIDGRKPEDCEAVIEWCQSEGCFWGPNILSGRKLRQKFDTLWGQMKQGRNRGKGNPDTIGAGPQPEGPSSWTPEQWALFEKDNGKEAADRLRKEVA